MLWYLLKYKVEYKNYFRKYEMLPELKEDVERGMNDSSGPQATPKITDHKPRELSELK